MLPSESRRSFTSSQSAARRRHRSTMTSSSALFFWPASRGARATLSYTDNGNPTGKGNTTPILRRNP